MQLLLPTAEHHPDVSRRGLHSSDAVGLLALLLAPAPYFQRSYLFAFILCSRLYSRPHNNLAHIITVSLCGCVPLTSLPDVSQHQSLYACPTEVQLPPAQAKRWLPDDASPQPPSAAVVRTGPAAVAMCLPALTSSPWLPLIFSCAVTGQKCFPTTSEMSG